MSMLACDECGDLIDTDFDPESHDEKSDKWICEGCRDEIALAAETIDDTLLEAEQAATAEAGERRRLQKIANAAQELVEQGLGSDQGYFPSPGGPLTKALIDALRENGHELVFQRGRWGR